MQSFQVSTFKLRDTEKQKKKKKSFEGRKIRLLILGSWYRTRTSENSTHRTTEKTQNPSINERHKRHLKY